MVNGLKNMVSERKIRLEKAEDEDLKEQGKRGKIRELLLKKVNEQLYSEQRIIDAQVISEIVHEVAREYDI